MEREPDTIEKTIEQLADGFAGGIDGLATGSYVREGVLKQAVTAVVWSIYHAFPEERYALADVLDDWPAVIRQAIDQDAKREQA